ncbi:acyltransferase [Jatrophihabitans telluris]|uniref:Acyltransferase n=1 Tax=Jatrophihabitans telluris TaxID=2038343 RepID=A0ABY4R1K1_9ACTN|nr:acyltransferase [Jatrophihabitans telluris]UQX89387.1 acyltransferase [Jatrophihabitans telluris]
MTEPVINVRQVVAPLIADAGAVVLVEPVRRERARWMDVLRGSAIILVVLWHSAAILRLDDYVVPDWLIRFNELFASYRMPVLMFLSGTLLARSLSKPLPVYAVGKARRILWPFLLWGLLNYAIHSHAVPIYEKVNWTTPYLWFLLYLLIFYAFAPLLRLLPTTLIVLVTFLVTEVPGLTEDERRFYFLAGFFFLGRLLSERRPLFERIISGRWVWGLAGVVIPFSIVFALVGPWRYYAVLAPFSVAGLLLFIKIARLPMVEQRTGALQFVGRDSIVYYCSHFPILTAVIYLAGKANLAVGLIVPIGFVLALGVGTLLAVGARSALLSWPFVAPFGAHATPRLAILDHPLLTHRSTRPALAIVQFGVSALALTVMIAFGARFL